MRKNFILRLALLGAVAFSMHSCMHDDFSNSQQEQAAPASSFKVFQKDSNGKEPDYARGFAALYWKYQEMHPKFKQAISKNLKENKPAVLFSLASEPLILDDGSRVVIYPVVAGSRITGLAAGVLNHEENYVSYQMVSETTEGYENMISAFRLRFSMLPKDILARVGGNGSGCNDVSGCGETGSTQIETIVIRPKPRTIQWGGSGDGSDDPWGNEPDGPPGGGCEGFGDCGGSTGNNPSAPEPPENPCEKTKNILTKPNVQQGINNIKAQALATLSNVNAGEIGFKEKKDGTLAPADVNSAHQVVFNNVTDSYGGYHNHTATGTHMFSPPDIVDALFGFAAAQSIQDGVGNAYLGMIAGEWCNTCPNNVQYIHYVIQYTGTGTELGGYVYTPTQMNQFLIDYRKKVNKLLKDPLNSNNNGATLNNIGLEKLFFDTLKKIGIDGKVNLQRIESNGVINNLTENSNGTINANPCP